MKQLKFVEPVTYLLNDDGYFPNSKFPLLLYKGVLKLSADDSDLAADEFEKVFAANNWTNPWRNGIFEYHHYHSVTHEVLAVYAGKANVQFGAPSGKAVEVEAGDVVVIPAGVAHRNLASSPDFKVLGAYPDGKDYDINLGKAGERPQADENIKATPLPENDPLYGADGPLIKTWRTA